MYALQTVGCYCDFVTDWFCVIGQIISLFLFFETGSYCVADLKLSYVDKASLKLTDICLPPPPECQD